MEQKSHERLKCLLEKQIQHVCTSDEEKELAFLISISDDKQLTEMLFANWENYESSEILPDIEAEKILTGIISHPDKIVDKRKSRKRLFFRYSIAASIAMLIAASVIEIFRFQDSEISGFQEPEGISQIQEPVSGQENEQSQVIAENKSESKQPVIAAKTNTVGFQDVKISRLQKPVSEQEIEQSRITNETIEPKSELESEIKSEPIQPILAEKINTDGQTEKNIILTDLNDNDYDDNHVVPVKKQKNKLSLLASLGSGSVNNDMGFSSSSIAQGEASSLTKSGIYAYADPKTQDIIDAQRFPDVTHFPSLSIGMMFNKAVNNTYSIEWGLAYTSLRSIFENKAQNTKASLHLHYIGLPVNFQAHISGNKSTKWGIYFSAGAMIEKGIYSRYRQDRYEDSYHHQITSKETIPGFRYSLSFAPGLDYKLSQKYSVFLEPKFSYYFKNKQLVSVRADHPVVFGINAGLKLGW